jgi:hypothetical protein
VSKKESIDKYQMDYPSNLTWKSRIWVLQPGNKVINKETQKIYEITQIIPSPVPGERPEVHANIYGSD